MVLRLAASLLWQFDWHLHLRLLGLLEELWCDVDEDFARQFCLELRDKEVAPLLDLVCCPCLRGLVEP